MLFLLLFFAQLLALYFTSRHLINQLFLLFFKLTKSKKISFYILSILFLPGTFIHEFSHLIAAVVTFVPVGHFSLWPEIDEEGGVKLGSVAIAHTDPFRRTFVGIAPILLGTVLLLTSIVYFTYIQSFFLNPKLAYLFIGYFVFVVSNTMFSSKKDLEHSWILLLAIAIAAAIAYYFGFFEELTLQTIQQSLDSVMSLGTLFLLVPLIVDLGLVILIKVI
jgi:hypothetical protein